MAPVTNLECSSPEFNGTNRESKIQNLKSKIECFL